MFGRPEALVSAKDLGEVSLASPGTEYCPTIHKFSTFVDQFHSPYTVVLDANDWRLSTCTCPYFLKKSLCKHVYALACVKNLHETDPYEQAPIGHARGPGRPKKALP